MEESNGVQMEFKEGPSSIHPTCGSPSSTEPPVTFHFSPDDHLQSSPQQRNKISVDDAEWDPLNLSPVKPSVENHAIGSFIDEGTLDHRSMDVADGTLSMETTKSVAPYTSTFPVSSITNYRNEQDGINPSDEPGTSNHQSGSVEHPVQKFPKEENADVRCDEPSEDILNQYLPGEVGKYIGRQESNPDLNESKISILPDIADLDDPPEKLLIDKEQMAEVSGINLNLLQSKLMQ